MNNSIGNTNPTIRPCPWTAAHRVALCVFSILIPSLAGAASWEINPVRIELSPQQQTAAVTLKNDTDQPTSIQIQAVAWSQLKGKDVYTPTKELLVSPPIVTIAAKSEQIIRVALRRQADAHNELTYRINLQELPPPSTPEFIGVKVALRISLPVFVQSQNGESAPKVVWRVSQMPDNKLKVGVENTGNAHIQISDFTLYVPGAEQAISGELGSTYILAGQEHEWLMKMSSLANTSGGRLRLKAYTDANNIDTELVLHKP